MKMSWYCCCSSFASFASSFAFVVVVGCCLVEGTFEYDSIGKLGKDNLEDC